jgi:hypothetical protein
MGYLLAYGTINRVVVQGVPIVLRRSIRFQSNVCRGASQFMEMGLGNIPLDKQGERDQASKEQPPTGRAFS